MLKKVFIVFVILAIGNVIGAKRRESSRLKAKHNAAHTHSKKHAHEAAVPTKRHVSRRQHVAIDDYVDSAMKYKIRPSKRVMSYPRSSNGRSSKNIHKKTFETVTPTTMKPKISVLPVRRINDMHNILVSNKSLGLKNAKTPSKDGFFKFIGECKNPVSGVSPLRSPAKTSVMMQLTNVNSKPTWCYA